MAGFKSAGIAVTTPGPESIPSHFQFKPLHIIAIDGEFLLYVFTHRNPACRLHKAMQM